MNHKLYIFISDSISKEHYESLRTLLFNASNDNPIKLQELGLNLVLKKYEEGEEYGDKKLSVTLTSFEKQ